MTRQSMFATIMLLVATSMAWGFQDYWPGQGGGQRGWGRGRSSSGRNGVPDWDNKEQFEKDVFTFARIQYSSMGYGRRGRGKWRTDYPDADLNLSFRLKQLTSLEVDPDGVVLQLTDPKLFDYPFIYLIEPGDMLLSEAEVLALRHYLQKGGFLMVDDFWGEYEWDNFYREIKRVFPDREPEEVPLEHEIFNIVYPIREKPMVPSVHAYMGGLRSERYDAEVAHYRAIYDDEGRIMAFICHNTDLGDGWEREGVDEGYFREYSEKFCYPLGINIVTYAMTH